MAGQFVRILPETAFRVCDAYRLQGTKGFGARFALSDGAVRADRFAELTANRQHRVKRGHRLLENHGDLAAADFSHLAFGKGDEITFSQPHFATRNARDPLGEESHHRKRSH
jgi:hypothetical protein